MASLPNESASNNPGLHEIADEATKGYFMQQTMFRIKDPKVRLDFYSRVLGMKLLKRLDFPEMKFSLYFMGYEDTTVSPTDPVERTVWTFSQKVIGALKMILSSKVTTMVMQNLVALACERFERLGVEFVKKPDDGKMKGLAFIKDTDGYWIEIFDLKRIELIASVNS